MKRFLTYFTWVPLALALLSSSATASPGHDHSHDEAPQAASAPASPRFEAHSELFEAVGVLHADELSVFIDRYADNAPVMKAKVELESGTTQAVGQFHEDHGDYSFDAKSFQKPGSYPISLTITAGGEVDILAGNLLVPDDTHSHSHNESSSLIKRASLWALGLAGVLAAVWLARRFHARRNAGGLT
ncbi:MAG: hypothetical protein ACO1NO_02505 [Burkholderiaceae bacterium]